jgi:hypothetical protein
MDSIGDDKTKSSRRTVPKQPTFNYSNKNLSTVSNTGNGRTLPHA